MGYLPALLGYPWLAPVYWTLGLEFQFYLVMAAVFPLLDRAAWCRTVLLLGLMSLERMATTDSVFISWGILFAAGIATFYMRDHARRHWLDAATGLLALGMILLDHGFAVWLAPITTVGIILTDCLPPFAALTWVGSISYLLYLFHWIIGQKIINLGGRLARNDTQRALWLIAGVLGSLAVSWVIWRVIEHPCRLLASRIRHSGPRVSEREAHALAAAAPHTTAGHDS